MRALAICALAACSYPEKIPIDGMGPPFGCLNAPPPTTADDPIIVSGTTSDPFTSSAIGNVTVTGQLTTIMSSLFVTHSDAMGNYRQQQATGGVPMDLYVHAAASGYLDSFYYPPHPVNHDAVFDVSLFTPQGSSTLAAAAQLTFNAADSVVILTVADCNGTPLAGATVTSSAAGTIRYFIGPMPSTTATATDSAGHVMVANMPPGNATLSATVSGMALKPRNVQSVAGAYVLTFIQP
jgi:hypothetical protein